MPFSQCFNLLVSDKNTHFTDHLATSAYEEENLAIPNGLSKFWLDYVTIRAREALSLSLEFYSSASFANASDLDRDTFLWGVPLQLQGLPASPTTIYTLSTYIDKPYIDTDANKQLHVLLRNRGSGAVTKSAGATGALVVKFAYREQF